MNTNPHISIVIPVYGCISTIRELYLQLCETLSSINSNFEILFINDASPDDVWEVISDLSKRDKRVVGLNLSRNFGQHAAITAGLDYCRGEWVVVMDCDLQDKPSEIINLYNKAKEGYDIVFARRVRRVDPLLKKMFSKMFYKALAYFTETDQDYTIGNFGIYRKKTITSLLLMKDRFRFFPTMIKWVGFKSTAIEVEHLEREHGKTSYSIRKLIDLGINTILTFSDKPLRLTVRLGLLFVFFSVLFTLYNLYLYFTGQILERGWTSLFISMWFLSGVIIFILGIIGLYIGKTFDSVKNRPIYIISERTDEDE